MNVLGISWLMLVWSFFVACAQNWQVTTWHADDGLPHVRVTTIAQTPDGFLWVGTPAGLARFDGVKFKVFQADGKSGLEDSRILSLLTDRNGTLWIGTQGGTLSRLRGQNFEPVTHPLPLDKDSARGAGVKRSNLLEDADGGIWWLLAGKGLARFHRGQWKSFTEADGLPAQPQDLARDESGAMWIAGPGKLFQFDGQRWTARTELPADWMSTPFAQMVRDGLWIVSFQGKLICRSDEEAAFMQSPPIMPATKSGPENVTALLEDRHGHWWAGWSSGGLCRLDDQGQWKALENPGAVALPSVACIFEDKQGNLWVGSTENGLHRIVAEPLKRVPAVGAPDLTTTSTCTRDGAIWIGTHYSGILKRTDQDFEPVPGDWGSKVPKMFSLLTDLRGEVWAGTSNGLFRFEDGRFQRVNAPFAPSTAVTAILEGKGGELWFGTYAGLYSWKAGNFQGFPISVDLRALAEDASGAIWIGAINSGLYRLSTSSPRAVEKVTAYPARHARTLHHDARGTLWAGSWGEGLFRYRDGKFENVGPGGWPSDKFQQIFTDPSGTLWAATNNGVFSIPLNIAESYVPGTGPPLLWTRYSSQLEFNQRSCTGPGSPVATRALNGHLWFPNMDHMAEVDPTIVRPGLEPANVHIEGVSLDGKDTPFIPGEILRASSATRQFEFQYTALDLTAPAAVLFRAKLDGMDANWIDAGAARTVRYSKLPPGDYQFRLMAGGADGVWREAAEPLHLAIIPLWWERGWVRLLGAVLVVGTAFGGVLWQQRKRAREKLRRLQMERQLDSERSRIARDIHDELGASLTQIMMLSTLARKPPEQGDANRELDQIHTTSRDLTRAMDEIVWAVDPTHDTLESLVDYLGRTAQEYLRAAGVRCRLEVPLEIPEVMLTSRIRHSLFLALKEGLNNVTKHSAATEAWFRLELSDTEFAFILEDNGKGISEDTVSPTKSGDRLISGRGMKNLSTRLQEVGGRLEITSQPGSGTRLALRIPRAPKSAKP